MTEESAPLFAPLEANSPVPLYRQIKDHIRQQIDNGVWPPGYRVPSENQIVRSLNVSRMTVNRALRELNQEGLLDRVAGVGSFVAEPPKHASLIELRNIAEEIAATGHTHSAHLVSQARTQATDALAARMEIDAGSDVFQVTLVHSRDDLPIQLEERWVNAAVMPNFLDADFRRRTPSEVLLEAIDPEEMEHVVQATMPDDETSSLLAIGSHEPCLRLLRRTWNRRRVVTFAVLTYPSSRYDLGARYQIPSQWTPSSGVASNGGAVRGEQPMRNRS